MAGVYVGMLDRIKFDDVMNFYPKHNHSIYSKIVAEQKIGSLIPFVGAGMSVFCGYKLWGAVLRELAEFILIEDKREVALKQINNGAYEKAAQMILKSYPAMLDQLPALISPDKLTDCPPEKLRASAAFVLPYLFQRGLIITTNFDRVLEHVYWNWKGGPIQTVTPNQQDRLTQLRQNQSLGVFKLHGDIGSETVSIDDLVFTGEQYKEKYTDGSPLVQELTRWLENHRLLFLGCSLNVDRTMDVLKSVTLAQPGIRHYAILGCEKADIPKRLKELNGLGILPVFYDHKDHNAVRIILERLLEETDQNSYKKLRAASWTAPAAAKGERRLLFDSDYFPFTGREQELESLEAFCASDEDISWWAVTGPGGMGKSRLVYEFTNQMCKEDWKIERFEAHPSKDSRATDLEALHEWLPETPRTIVVLDDVQSHMEQVRQWLNEVVRHPRSEKLRILLLEREGKDLNSSSWLGAEPYSDIPVEWCHDKNFLYLNPMNDADLITIMDDYAAAAGKKLNAELLLKTLERVDPKLKRPLYAIAIADASCQGKDPTSWDQKKVLDTLLNRELDFHFNRLQDLTGKKATKTLRSELKELLARSCIHGFLLLNDAGIERYPKLAKKIEDSDMDLQEFLEGLGILRTIRLRSIVLDQFGNPIGKSSEKKQQKVIALSCPDLIKEHLVLNLALEDNKGDLLFPQDWEQDSARLSFIEQLLLDYNDRLKNQNDYWNTIFQATPQNVRCARVYGDLLWGYAAYYPDGARIAIDRLAQLYDEMQQDSEIAVAYANGLASLTIGQDLERCTATVAQLDEFYRNHPNIPEVVIAYVSGLLNLTVDQDSERQTVTVARMDELYRNHPNIPEVAVEYAKGLVNQTANQDLRESTAIVARLDEIYKNHLDIPEIAVVYADGLFNLTINHDLRKCTAIVARLGELYRSHPDIPEVVVAYASGLFNLTVDQDLTESTVTIARLDKLYRNHPEILEVAVEYAKGLVNLTFDQDLKVRTATVARLNGLYRNHPKIPEVAVEYAKGLVNLATDQDLKECTATVERLDELYRNHPDILEIVGQFAEGLANLTAVQDLEGSTATVAQLDTLYQSYPESEDVVVAFADCLVDFALHQESESEVRNTLARSKAVLDRYPKNNSIQLAHAMTWFNLTLQQREADIPTTIADIISFLRSHADVIPQFKEALDEYLSAHPDHAGRYQPLLHL